MNSTQKNLLLVGIVTVVVFPVAFFLYLWTAPRISGPDPTINCGMNLQQIDGAKQQWAIEHNTLRTQC